MPTCFTSYTYSFSIRSPENTYGAPNTTHSNGVRGNPNYTAARILCLDEFLCRIRVACGNNRFRTTNVSAAGIINIKDTLETHHGLTSPRVSFILLYHTLSYLSIYIATLSYNNFRGDKMKPLKEKISITIDGDLLEKIKALADKDDRSLSQYINIALKQHIGESEKKEPVMRVP